MNPYFFSLELLLFQFDSSVFLFISTEMTHQDKIKLADQCQDEENQ